MSPELLLATALTVVLSLSPSFGYAQSALPAVTVTAPARARAAKPQRPRKPVATVSTRIARRGGAGLRSRAVDPGGPTPIAVAKAAPQTPAQAVAAGLDRARDTIFTRAGANATDLGRDGIERLPQGDNQTLDRVLLQLPGVTQDSAASGSFHIRNEHANVQVRINGIQLPEGILGLGQFLETSFVGNISLLDGALPAQYGLRTAGILDITSRQGVFDGGGAVSIYGGSRDTVTPSAEVGGSVDGWNYFVTGRYLANRQGIENPAPTFDPIHDLTSQGRYFAYLTKEFDATTRLAFISGAYSGRFQIPNNPGQLPSFSAFGITDFDSRALKENQYERNTFNVVALQKSIGAFDIQVSAFSRYSTVRYVPDAVGDLLFNGNATDVFRSSLSHGVQADVAYRWNFANTTRFGAFFQTEHTRVVNGAIVLPTGGTGCDPDADLASCDPAAAAPPTDPLAIVDRSAQTGYTLSGYVQHEWKLTNRIAINAGLRFDQNWSYVTDNQLSPRAGVTWQPIDGTVFHAGYARYFTPPSQALSAPTNVAAFTGTTLEPDVTDAGRVRPERAHYLDIGVDQAITAQFKVGVDAYYKYARNLLDDGQFGPALVLTTFNYDRAYNTGVEFKAIYEDAFLRAYANFAWARQRATQVTSNQFLFDADELAYIANHYVYTDHAQTITASAGANLRVLDKTRVGFSLIYGSGLRAGFANTDHVPGAVQVNLGATQDFRIPGLAKDTMLRFDVVNLFDNTYLIRDGSGIGVFAPQYGQRRGFYAGVTQRF